MDYKRTIKNLFVKGKVKKIKQVRLNQCLVEGEGVKIVVTNDYINRLCKLYYCKNIYEMKEYSY